MLTLATSWWQQQKNTVNLTALHDDLSLEVDFFRVLDPFQEITMNKRQEVGALSLLAFALALAPGQGFGAESVGKSHAAQQKALSAKKADTAPKRKDKITLTCVPGSADYDIDKCHKEITGK